MNSLNTKGNIMNQQQRIDAVNLLVDHAFQTNPVLLLGVCRVLGLNMQFHLFEEMGMAIFDILTEDIGIEVERATEDLGVKDEYK